MSLISSSDNYLALESNNSQTCPKPPEETSVTGAHNYRNNYNTQMTIGYNVIVYKFDNKNLDQILHDFVVMRD